MRLSAGSVWLVSLSILLGNPVWSNPVPYPMVWNTTHVFGPDGPWQAIPLRVGWPEQLVNLYPGGSWASTLLGTGVCAGRSSCVARRAGLYDFNKSNNATTDGTANHGIGGGDDAWTRPLDPEWRPKNPLQLAGNGTLMTDRIRFESPNGATEISNFSIVTAHTANMTLPDRSTVPLSVGFLALGAKDTFQFFKSDHSAVPDYVAHLLPGWLAMNGKTPSNSWSLHIGSAVPSANISGSLVFGGYDESRVIGDVGTFDVPSPGGDMSLNLLDVGIGVDAGGSPFPFESIDGLLKPADGTSRGRGGSLPVRPNPTVPYLFLPANTCQEITKHLPVTYAAGIDLYVWKTEDPAFARIVTSPSFLRFTFQGASHNLTIKVPFRLLNLTVTPPLVKSPQAYFPCRAYIPPADSKEQEYHLGRAFLQAAFMGMTWAQNKWWLAQAPGPKTVVASLRPIGNSTMSISSFEKGNWSASWDGVWTPLPHLSSRPTDVSSSSSSPMATSTTGSIPPPTSENPSSTSSMPRGTQVGLGVGLSLGSLGAALGVGAILFYRRRLRRRQTPQPPWPSLPDKITFDHHHPGAMVQLTSSELDGGGAAAFEMEAPQTQPSAAGNARSW